MSTPTPATPDLRRSVEIPLQFPINVDGLELNSVTMRRPKLRDTLDAKKVKGDDMNQGIAMIASLCDLAPEHIAELDELDFESVQKQYMAFTGKVAKTES